MDNGEIILFQTQGGESKIEVRLSDETVWLTADQMAELFQRNKSTISRHIKNQTTNDIDLLRLVLIRNYLVKVLESNYSIPNEGVS